MINNVLTISAPQYQPSKATILRGLFCIKTITHYLSAGEAIVIKRDNAAFEYYFPYTDHLGSIVAVTNTSGALIAEQNFDAWGRKRNVTTWDYVGVQAVPDWLYRGYTGHEHLAEFGLINMNARLYDPVLGRMLSPDNFTHGGSQGYNRYSYANNNPLKFVDPDGNEPLLFAAIIGAFINIAVNADKIDSPLKFFGYAAIGAGAGALGGAVGLGVSSAIGGGTFAAGFLGTSAAVAAPSGFWASGFVAASGAFAGGFTNTFFNELTYGTNIGSAFGKGFIDGIKASGSAFLLGGTIGGIDAVGNNRNFFSGLETTKTTKVLASVATGNAVQQQGEYDCLPSCLEYVDGTYGGTRSKSHFIKQLGGYYNPAKGTETSVASLQAAGAKDVSQVLQTPESVAAQLNSGGSAIVVKPGATAHAMVARGVEKVTIVRNGKILWYPAKSTNYFINVMNPDGGVFRRYNTNELMRNLFRFRF